MNLTKHWAAQLDDYIIDLAWSPDGTQLAAASASGPIHLYSRDNGQLRHTLPGHTDGTNCLAWQPPSGHAVESQNVECPKSPPAAPGGDPNQSSDKHPARPGPNLRPSTCLASGGQDGSVKFWDAAAGQHTATANLGNAWVEHLAWRPGGHQAVESLNVESPKSPPAAPGGAPTQSRDEHPARPGPDLRPSTTSILAAASGRVLTLLRPDGTTTHTFKPAPKTISALCWHPQGGALASAYFGGVCLWDADDFHAQKEFPYSNGIATLAWSPDLRWLVSGNQDPSVHLWLVEQDQEFHMSGYESKVKELSFDHTSRWLATSGGQDACLWDCTGAGPEGREPAMLPHDAKVCALAFQNTHGILATASTDGAVQLWSPDRKQPLRASIKMPAAATKLSWTPDDRHLAIGSEKGIVYVLTCEP